MTHQLSTAILIATLSASMVSTNAVANDIVASLIVGGSGQKNTTSAMTDIARGIGANYIVNNQLGGYVSMLFSGRQGGLGKDYTGIISPSNRLFNNDKNLSPSAYNVSIDIGATAGFAQYYFVKLGLKIGATTHYINKMDTTRILAIDGIYSITDKTSASIMPSAAIGIHGNNMLMGFNLHLPSSQSNAALLVEIGYAI